MSPKSSLASFGFVEALESRIAPAVITVGPQGDHGYNSALTPFHKTTDVFNDFNANYVGGTDTYYIKLSKGDTLRYISANGFVNILGTTTSKADAGIVGNAVAFFVDKDGGGDVDLNELTGLSLGKGVSLKVGTDIDGDIVTNFNDATGQIVPDMAAAANFNPAAQTIAKLTTENLDLGGSATGGNIFAGGAISNLTVRSVDDIRNGSAIDGQMYNFNSNDGAGAGPNDLATVDGTLTFTPADKAAGPNMTGLSINALDNLIAGTGGAGAKGGSITTAKILTDQNGFVVQAGAGGDANAAVNIVKGGVGGSITSLFVHGIDDTGAAGEIVQIAAGAGGAGDGTTGVGGAGGNLTSIFVGYEAQGKTQVQSADLLEDRVHLEAGDGGAGDRAGGAGGFVKTVKIASLIPDSNMAGTAIEVFAGSGGQVNVDGASNISGAGGAVTSVDARIFTSNAVTQLIDIQGGDAGTTSGLSKSGKGGAVTTVMALGFNLDVSGGDGQGGSVGGAGGLVQNVNALRMSDIMARTVDILGGAGGNGAAGSAGAGGEVKTVRVNEADLTALTINGGDGGTSDTAAGGAGGRVSDVRIEDLDIAALTGAVTITGGTGGGGSDVSGSGSGGAGGALIKVDLVATGLDLTMNAGSGGNSMTLGNGGVGGALTSFSLNSDGFANLDAGNGGNGAGASGKGGAGGATTTIGVSSGGSASLQAGNGGTGAGGAAGAGGAISGASLQSATDLVALVAGNAGAGGTKGANGGAITKSTALAFTDVTITAGNGAQGGAGGALTSVAYANSLGAFAPTGTITIQSGAGSTGATTAGAGGNITTLNGYVSSGAGETTTITAGNGAASTDGKKVGNGGTINGVEINGGGNTGSELTIKAGDSDDAANVTTGGRGGDVRNVSVAELAAGSIFRSIAAGNAGDGLTNGGLGGTIDRIFAQADIGVRNTGPGVPFGYTQMGGLFAGRGGDGGTKDGLNGNVTNVYATAIASIVADYASTPALVNLVDKVYLVNLNGNLVVPTVNAGGMYTNYDTANYVAGVDDPTEAEANNFEFTDNDASATFTLGDMPIDGIVMATILTNKRNFVPEASLVNTTFTDFQNNQ